MAVDRALDDAAVDEQVRRAADARARVAATGGSAAAAAAVLKEVELREADEARKEKPDVLHAEVLANEAAAARQMVHDGEAADARKTNIEDKSARR